MGRLAMLWGEHRACSGDCQPLHVITPIGAAFLAGLGMEKPPHLAQEDGAFLEVGLREDLEEDTSLR